MGHKNSELGEKRLGLSLVGIVIKGILKCFFGLTLVLIFSPKVNKHYPFCMLRIQKKKKKKYLQNSLLFVGGYNELSL